MIVVLSNHAKQQRAKRKPDKTDEWMEWIFCEAIKAIRNKNEINVNGDIFRPKQQLCHYTEHGKVFKVKTGKYGFVYDKTGSVYTIITFLTKEDRLYIGDTVLNLNLKQYESIRTQ